MNIDFNKNNDGLVPAIIQDATTKNILMLGYMNEAAFEFDYCKSSWSYMS